MIKDLKVFATFITVISITILCFACSSKHNTKAIWVEIERYGDVPPFKNQSDKIDFYFTNNQVEIYRYKLDSILVNKSNSFDLLTKIKADMVEQHPGETLNTFILNNGQLKYKGCIDIDVFEQYLEEYLENSETTKKVYYRLYSEGYEDFELGYLEHYVNFSTKNFKFNPAKWKIIDKIEARLLADSSYGKTYTLAQNLEGKFVLFNNDESSIEFDFNSSLAK
jgi:hypothetical protein